MLRRIGLILGVLLVFSSNPAAAKTPNGFNLMFNVGFSGSYFDSTYKRIGLTSKVGKTELLGADDIIQRIGFNLSFRLGYAIKLWRGLYISPELLFDWTYSKSKGLYREKSIQTGKETKIHNLISTGGFSIGYAAFDWMVPWMSVGVGYGFMSLTGIQNIERFAGGFAYALGTGIDFKVVRYFYIGPAFRFKHFSYNEEQDALKGKGKIVSFTVQFVLQL